MSLLHGRDRCEAIPINPQDMIVRRPNRGSACSPRLAISSPFGEDSVLLSAEIAETRLTP
jgi:hypothetical protein